MKSTLLVTKELLQNFSIIHRLALSDLLLKTKDGFFGFFWIWLNPAFQIFIYGVIFGAGIRTSLPVNGVEYFVWLATGIIMWLYITGSIVSASRSIIAKIGTVTKMKFPVSLLPVTVVFTNLYIHILMLITILVILFLYNIPFTVYYFQIFYYIFASTALLISMSIFNSAITTIVRDYQHIVYNTMRTMFFVTPIIFPEENFSGILSYINTVNPFAYLVSGYRESMLYQSSAIFRDFNRGLIFWSIVIFIYILGSIFHIRMRKNLLDYA